MSKTLDNVKTYGKKLGVISVMTVGNLAPMALNTMTQMGVAHANTNVTAGNKQQGLDVNVPHNELDKAVSEAKKAGVNVTNKGNKSVVVNSADSDKTQKAIASDYDSQVKALKSATDTQLANNAKYDQDQKDYAKNLVDWNTYWKNPDIVGGQTDWTKSDLMKFLGGDGANATYINASKQMKLDMGNLKAVSKSEFDKVKKTMKGTIIKSMTAPEDSKHVMVKISKGSYFKYTKAVKNNKTDHMVDIKYTATNINDKKGNKLAHYIILDKTDIGADQMQPMKDVSWGMDFYKAGTNVAENMDPLVGAADVDGDQYIKIKGASSLLIGKNLKKGADGLVTSSDKSVEPEDTSNQAWYLLKNVTHVDFTYGTNDNPNGISNWSDDYWTMGNIDFAVKLKPKPVAPTKPKAVTASYQLTDLTVKPSNHKDVTADGQTTSINGKEVKIDQVIDYPFTDSALPANRVDDIKSYVLSDNIPDGLTITGANKTQAIKNLGSDWKLEIKGRQVTISATDSLLKKMNADKSKAFNVPTPKLPATVSKGGVTIKNHVDTIINGNIDVTSNTVVNPTEKADPSLIVKKVETSDGKLADDVANANIIDGKEVAFDIFSQVDNMNATNDVNYSDQLPKDAKVDVSKIKVYMSTDKVDASTMTKDKLTTLSYKTDVTKDFDISFKDGKLSYTPKAGKTEAYKGKQLKVRFMSSLAEDKVADELDSNGNNIVWNNTASNGQDESNNADYNADKPKAKTEVKTEIITKMAQTGYSQSWFDKLINFFK